MSTTDQTFTLQQFPEKLAVVRLAPGAEIPQWAESSSLFSITATATETSLVCATRSVPTKTPSQKPFTAFAVQGPLDFALTGRAQRAADAAGRGGDPRLHDLDLRHRLDPGPGRRRRTTRPRPGAAPGHTVAAAVPVVPEKKRKTASKGPSKKTRS